MLEQEPLGASMPIERRERLGNGEFIEVGDNSDFIFIP